MIPIGPDFQDPVGSQNYAPVLQEATPPFYSTVSVSLAQPQEISAFATDVNSGDTLYYEWVLDYPPYVPGTTIEFVGTPLPPPVSGPQTRIISTTLNCALGSAPNGPTQHLLELIVGDRPLMDDLPNGVLGIPTKGGGATTQGWIVILQCLPPGAQ